MHWYVTVLKKYALFGGRARHKEYWPFACSAGCFAGLIPMIEGRR
jgi:uncharacterized membrane protein YhaH (DUF805 family)